VDCALSGSSFSVNRFIFAQISVNSQRWVLCKIYHVNICTAIDGFFNTASAVVVPTEKGKGIATF
jgi:hypothetical protein